MPATQPVAGDRVGGVSGGVERHIHDSFHVAVASPHAPVGDAEPAGDRRTHLVRVEVAAFDGRRFHDVAGEHPEGRRGLQIEAERPHPAEEQTLGVTRCRE